MRKSPPYSFALALAAVLALATLFPSTPSSAKGPKKPIPPECLTLCFPVLVECVEQSLPDDPHCFGRYQSCLAHCK